MCSIRRCPKLLPSRKESGSAVLDFVLVAAPMLLITLGVITFCVATYSLGVIRDTAVEGARFAALADQSSSSGCIRAQSLLAKAIVPSIPRSVTCSALIEEGIEYERVEISVRMPVLGLVAGPRQLSAESMAPREQ